MVTLDEKGRITIPKKIREKLDIEEGGGFLFIL